MAKETISFTIEVEQLAQVRELMVELDRDRSSTLRELIRAGLPVLRAHRAALGDYARGQLVETGQFAPGMRFAPETK